MRPWMTFGERLSARTIVEDAGVVLWESGEKTTPEIKREIIDLLDQIDSLVAVLDLKAAERPEDPRWWPSLRVVQTWQDEDPFFGKAIDQWKHARQERILERVIYDLNCGTTVMGKAELALLKERVKFASSVLPRIVNKGLREKVDIETRSNHLHLHAGLSDEALMEKIAEMRRNPHVRNLLALEAAEGSIPGELAAPVMPPAPRTEPAHVEFQDPEAFRKSLMEGAP